MSYSIFDSYPRLVAKGQATLVACPLIEHERNCNYCFRALAGCVLTCLTLDFRGISRDFSKSLI